MIYQPWAAIGLGIASVWIVVFGIAFIGVAWAYFLPERARVAVSWLIAIAIISAMGGLCGYVIYRSIS